MVVASWPPVAAPVWPLAASSLQVRLVLVGGDHPDGEHHPAVVETAQLRALTREGAGLGRGQLELVGAARDDVQLEVERGHPEGVDDVRRGQVEVHRLVHRQHQLGGLVQRAGLPDAFLAVDGLLVVERPLPLLADHVDRVRRVVRHRGDLVAVLDRVEEQHTDDRERRQCVEHLERQVVARLPRRVLAAPAVPDRCEQDQAPGENTDDQGGDPGADPEAPDRFGAVGRALGQTESFPLLGGLRRAGGQHQGAHRY